MTARTATMVAGYLAILMISGPSVRTATLIAPALVIVVINGVVRRSGAGEVDERRVNARPFEGIVGRGGASPRIGGTVRAGDGLGGAVKPAFGRGVVPKAGARTHVRSRGISGRFDPLAPISRRRFA